jgi:hypothetical protein
MIEKPVHGLMFRYQYPTIGVLHWPTGVDAWAVGECVYCFLQNYLNFLVSNCPQILEPWFNYLRSTL